MPQRRLNIDFYRVRMPDNCNRLFEACVDGVHQSPRDSRRNCSIGGDPVRLHACHDDWNGCIEGDMTRIRMDDLPSRASLGGDVEPIDLNDDEGIGEQCAFLYHPATQVLLHQTTRASVSARWLAIYFTQKSGLNDPIFLDPVLRSDAVQRLASIAEVRKFAVRVARVNNAQVFAGQGRSVRGMTEILEQFAAPTLGVEVSMGKKRAGTLTVEAVKQAAIALLGHSDAEHNRVTKIEIAGRTEDAELDELDLVTEKLREVMLVETDERRRVPYALRREALRRAFTKREQELRSMFRP